MRGDTRAANLARVFAGTMSRIADAVLVFCDRHRTRDEDELALRRDWKTVKQLLSWRIQDEEQTLHALFRQLLETAAAAPAQS